MIIVGCLNTGSWKQRKVYITWRYLKDDVKNVYSQDVKNVYSQDIKNVYSQDVKNVYSQM